jgi:hypothetical protein
MLSESRQLYKKYFTLYFLRVHPKINLQSQLIISIVLRLRLLFIM